MIGTSGVAISADRHRAFQNPKGFDFLAVIYAPTRLVRLCFGAVCGHGPVAGTERQSDGAHCITYILRGGCCGRALALG